MKLKSPNQQFMSHHFTLSNIYPHLHDSNLKKRDLVGTRRVQLLRVFRHAQNQRQLQIPFSQGRATPLQRHLGPTVVPTK